MPKLRIALERDKPAVEIARLRTLRYYAHLIDHQAFMLAIQAQRDDRAHADKFSNDLGVCLFVQARPSLRQQVLHKSAPAEEFCGKIVSLEKGGLVSR